MEIEAKYALDAPVTPEIVAGLDLSPYRLDPGERHLLRDILLDSPSRALERHGISLRIRQDGASVLMTLKGAARDGDAGAPADLAEAAQWRDELELPIEGGPSLDPTLWPEPITQRYRALAGLARPIQLGEVRNRRVTWLVRRAEPNGPVVAEIALDDGYFLADGDARRPFHELEVELKGAGTVNDLRAIVTRLQALLPLRPERRTKAQRARAFVDKVRAAGLPSVPPFVAAVVAPDPATPSPAAPPAPGAVPALKPPPPDDPIARELLTGESVPRAASSARQAPFPPGEPAPATGSGSLPGLTSADPGTPPLQPVEAGVALHPNLDAAAPDGAETQEPPRARPGLEAASEKIPAPAPPPAASSQAARPAGAARPTDDGAASAPGLAEVVAPAAPPSETGSQGLETTAPPLSGGAASRGGARTADALDVAAPPVDSGDGTARAEASVAMTPTASLAEAGRRLLRDQYERLLEMEPIARAGEDPRGAHQLRVATRRLRAALRVLEDTVYEPSVTRRFRRGLRALANAVAAVREADVLLADIDAYAARLSAGEALALEPLRRAVAERRQRDHAAMLRALDDGKTRRLLDELGDFVRTPGAGVRPHPPDALEVPPTLVRHFAGSTIWRRYEAVLAYETALPAPVETLHRLRVAGKWLRYTLEFFAEALPGGARDVLKPIVAMQDELGALNDDEVAVRIIDEVLVERATHLDAGSRRYRVVSARGEPEAKRGKDKGRPHPAEVVVLLPHEPGDPATDPVLAALTAYRRARLDHLDAGATAFLHGGWPAITGAPFRRKLLDLIAAL